jgi:hypothetical protein
MWFFNFIISNSYSLKISLECQLFKHGGVEVSVLWAAFKVKWKTLLSTYILRRHNRIVKHMSSPSMYIVRFAPCEQKVGGKISILNLNVGTRSLTISLNWNPWLNVHHCEIVDRIPKLCWFRDVCGGAMICSAGCIQGHAENRFDATHMTFFFKFCQICQLYFIYSVACFL